MGIFKSIFRGKLWKDKDFDSENLPNSPNFPNTNPNFGLWEIVVFEEISLLGKGNDFSEEYEPMTQWDWV